MLKYVYLFLCFLTMECAFAQSLVIDNVKVSVTDKSAGEAKEVALEQAHDLAFEKLLELHFPDKQGLKATHEDVLNMVSGFSIEREDSKAKTYTALLAFQFDLSKVMSWAQGHSYTNGVQNPSAVEVGQVLRLMAQYENLHEWNRIKKVLLSSQQIHNVIYEAISFNQAELKATLTGSVDKFKELLNQNGLSVSQLGDKWVVSFKAPVLGG